MAVHYLYGGVDQVDTTVLIKGTSPSLTSAADGSLSTAEFVVLDPTGTLTYKALQTWAIEEDLCSQPRMFTGIIYNVKVARGRYTLGAGREWTLSVTDLNGFMHLRVLRGASAKRPRESFDARMAWLLASVGMAGLVYDNGQIAARSAQMFDEADYHDQYPDDVCASIASGWVFFVYWDPVALQPSLFFNLPTASAHASTLAISNVPGDYNGSTVFWAEPGPELDGAGEDIYDGVSLTFAGGANIYRQRAATYTEFGVHRDFVYTSDRIGHLATAEAAAAGFLLDHSGRVDTITCVVKLPPAQVNLLDAGMRVSARFEHLPGYSTAVWTRIARRTLPILEGKRFFYSVTLTLSTRGITSPDGGSPGGFPYVPPAAEAVVQTGCGFNLGANVNLIFPAGVALGSMLVAWEVARGTSSISPPAGWTQVGPTVHVASATDSPAAMYYKVADSGDVGLTTFLFNATAGSSRPKILGWELSGVDAPTASVSSDNATGTSFSLPALTVGAGIAIAGIGTGSDAPSPASITPFDHFYIEAGDGFWQTAMGADRITTPGAVTFAVAFTVSGGGNGHDGVAAFFPASATVATSPPPRSTWFYDVVPTPVADGTTTTFTLPAGYEFTDGSLIVKVDRLDQTLAVTSYDGAARTFVLGFAPKVGEKVEVTGQAR